MKLFTYKGKSRVEEMQRVGELVPHSRATLDRHPMGKPQYWFHNSMRAIRKALGGNPRPFFRGTTGIFSFLPGYESSEWTRRPENGVSELDQLLNPIRRTDELRSNDVYLLSWEATPEDGVLVFEYDFMKWFMMSTAMDPDLVNEERYYHSATSLFEYDGGFKLPEAVCFLPISADRFAIEEVISLPSTAPLRDHPFTYVSQLRERNTSSGETFSE
jgi:hypothetical protein